MTCAIALKDCPSSNVEINLYEQAAQITQIGAGIAVWPRTWEVLKSLGLEKDLTALLKEPYNPEQSKYIVISNCIIYQISRTFTRATIEIPDW